MGSITCEKCKVIALQWLPEKISIPEVNPKVNMFPGQQKFTKGLESPRKPTPLLGLETSEISPHSELGHLVRA